MSSLLFYPPTSYTAAPPPPPPRNDYELNNSSSSSSSSRSSRHLNLRYATALSLGFLLCFALILLSYICFRFSRRRQPNPNTTNPNPNFATADNGIILSRRIFVAEDEDDDQTAVIGLHQAVINSYPKFPFVIGSDGDSVCAICLCEYKDADMLRMLPDCRHFFHLTCVDEWLRLNASCPVCRNSPLPTPLSTPLSEVVPLSLYTDGRNRRRWGELQRIRIQSIILFLIIAYKCLLAWLSPLFSVWSFYVYTNNYLSRSFNEWFSYIHYIDMFLQI